MQWGGWSWRFGSWGQGQAGLAPTPARQADIDMQLGLQEAERSIDLAFSFSSACSSGTWTKQSSFSIPYSRGRTPTDTDGWVTSLNPVQAAVWRLYSVWVWVVVEWISVWNWSFLGAAVWGCCPYCTLSCQRAQGTWWPELSPEAFPVIKMVRTEIKTKTGEKLAVWPWRLVRFMCYLVSW